MLIESKGYKFKYRIPSFESSREESPGRKKQHISIEEAEEKVSVVIKKQRILHTSSWGVKNRNSALVTSKKYKNRRTKYQYWARNKREIQPALFPLDSASNEEKAVALAVALPVKVAMPPILLLVLQHLLLIMPELMVIMVPVLAELLLILLVLCFLITTDAHC
ncbi:hypothetical protein BT96DRAFT_942471 [Gymnopus androsaceus JB14]|uniref:Uncharacterized protein n=1 Tax=Gymnopus androsaceus JB14 TaxID=1447944 RepID=A0A6A4HDN8_9AGAR|nr:hypothetical protein BT96DRAFT_942471 [Gymnopus androsaceus JB14]